MAQASLSTTTEIHPFVVVSFANSFFLSFSCPFQLPSIMPVHCLFQPNLMHISAQDSKHILNALSPPSSPPSSSAPSSSTSSMLLLFLNLNTITSWLFKKPTQLDIVVFEKTPAVAAAAPAAVVVVRNCISRLAWCSYYQHLEKIT